MGILILIRWSISEMWLFVNLRAVSTYCMSFQEPQMLGFVHKPSIAHPPNTCKSARRSSALKSERNDGNGMKPGGGAFR